MGTILGLLILFEILFTIAMALRIAVVSEGKTILVGLKEYITNLFTNKNVFGIILSSLLMVLLIPAFVMYLLMLILECIINLFIIIWNLGVKKDV